MNSPTSAFRSRWLAPFVISWCGLSLQFVQTRILSFIYWQHLVYSVVTISLLGFAASGTVLSLSKRLREEEEGQFVCRCLAGFAFSSVLSVLLVTLLSGEYFHLSWQSVTALNVVKLLIAYLFSSVPFVFFGLLLLGLFQRHPGDTGAIYAANLGGSAIGCVLYVLAIRWLGAPLFLCCLVVLPALATSLLFQGSLRKNRSIAFTVLMALFVGSPFFHFSPDPNKQFWSMFSPRTVEFTEWNALSRVDVITHDTIGSKAVLIDGDAQSPIFPSSGRVLGEATYAWSKEAARRNSLPKIELQTAGWAQLGISLFIEPVPKGETKQLTLRLSGPEGGRGWIFNFNIDTRTPNLVYLGIDTARAAALGIINSAGSWQSLPPNQRLGAITSVSLQGEGGHGLPFTSLVRDVYIWNRALSEAEVRASQFVMDGPERHLAFIARLEEGARNPNEVLVIGNGGGADTMLADRYASNRISSVEINPTSYDLVRNRYSDYLGNLFRQKNVELYLEDGRSFVRRSSSQYDVITMIGVDSLAASSSGAYVLSESYLYTYEAFAEYWSHLSPTGKMQISRWHFPKGPRETLRLFTTAFEVLSGMRVADPARHIMVVCHKNAKTSDGSFATLLLSKNALSAEVLTALRRWLDQAGMELIFDPYEQNTSRNAFYQYVSAVEQGSKEVFFSNYPFNVRPVTDDNPFFFQYGRWSHVLGSQYPAGPPGFESILGRWPFFIIASLLGICLIALAAVIGIPLRQIQKFHAVPGRMLFFFACLGLAFMFVEMCLIQKFVLILGHPIYSMAVTIPAVLVSAAVGSRVSQRLKFSGDPATYIPFLLLSVALLGFYFVFPVLFQVTSGMSFSLRVVLAALLVVPVGCLMGIPFPTGMRCFGRNNAWVPLAWAVNAGMSVLASVLAIVIAMELGFGILLILSVVLYGLAGVSLASWVKAPSALLFLSPFSRKPHGLSSYFLKQRL